jgi:SAM-dependent methyltransferase
LSFGSEAGIVKFEQFALHAEIEDRQWWFVGRRAIITSVVRAITADTAKATIVDVGCGTGGNLSDLAHDHNCVGIDSSGEAIEFAKKRFPDVRFICGNVPHDLGGIKDDADVFMLLDVVEHVEHDSEFLRDLLGVVRPGGHVVITVPALMSLWSPHDANYGHFRRYEPEQLKTLWEGLPVTVPLFSFFNAYLYPVVKAVRSLNRWRGHEWGEAGTDLTIPPWPLNGLLTSIFAREARVLVDLLSGNRKTGFARGVSLMAVLRKENR